jgi:hypothetical protein
LGYDLSLNLDFATKATNNLNTGTVAAYKSFAAQSKGIKDDLLPATDLLTGSTNNLAVANDKVAKSAKSAAAANKELSATQRELNALKAGGALSGGMSADQAAFFRSELSLISQFGGFIEGINAKPGDPFYGFGRGSNVNTALQQRAGGSATATGGVTINVQGLVIDPEGAARAIEQLISDSNARGGAVFEDLFGINP